MVYASYRMILLRTRVYGGHAPGAGVNAANSITPVADAMFSLFSSECFTATGIVRSYSVRGF